MAKSGMAIDLNKCVGCGTCAIACKTENNTEHQNGGTKYNWCDFYTKTEGAFPTVSYTVIPVLCNHCSNPDCIPVCPTSPKALFKTSDGVTMINESRCIGCQLCQDACRYSTRVVSGSIQYSVLSYNSAGTSSQNFWNNGSPVLPGGTSSPMGTAIAAGVVPPYKNAYTHTDYTAVRPSGVVEKCYLCYHRTLNGEQPYCVASCPTGARTYGDLDDSQSPISLLLAANPNYRRLKDYSGEFLDSADDGTDPNVYYLGDFSELPAVGIKETKKEIPRFTVYPNPATDNAFLEYDLPKPSPITIAIYDIGGRIAKIIMENEPRSAGKNTEQISMSGFSAGTYICVIRTNERAMTANIMVGK